jgi:hypothetical protein
MTNDMVYLLIWEGVLFVNIGFMMLICQPKLTIDVAPCFVLPANRSLVLVILRPLTELLSCDVFPDPSTQKEYLAITFP